MSTPIKPQHILNDWAGESDLSFFATCGGEQVAFYLLNHRRKHYLDNATIAFVWPAQKPLRLVCSLESGFGLGVRQGGEAEEPLRAIAAAHGEAILPFIILQDNHSDSTLEITVGRQIYIKLIHASTLDALPGEVAAKFGQRFSFAPPRRVQDESPPPAPPLELNIYPTVLRPKAARSIQRDREVHEALNGRQELLDENESLIQRVRVLQAKLAAASLVVPGPVAKPSQGPTVGELQTHIREIKRDYGRLEETLTATQNDLDKAHEQIAELKRGLRPPQTSRTHQRA